MSSDFSFLSRWTVGAPIDRVWDELERLLATDDPMVWWPAVRVESYTDGVVSASARSIGYVVRFRLQDLVLERPDRLSFDATGDLHGRGVARFGGDEQTTVEIDWRVEVSRPWMRRTSWLLRPVFTAGHHLVMHSGERRFDAWMRRRT